MGTLIGQYLGTTAGPSVARFRAVCELQYTQDTGSRRFIQRRYYIEVTVGHDYGWAEAIPSWKPNSYNTLSTAGIYVDTGWQDYGWVSNGDVVDCSCNAYYVAESGTIRRSTVTGSYTFISYKTTVTFDKNDGSGVTDQETYYYGGNNQLNARGWKRTGYTLAGWSTNAAESWSGNILPVTATVTDDYIIAAGEAITLYAIWKPVSVTVTFMKNDGTQDNVKKTYYVDGNGRFNDCGFRRSGYTLTGWAFTADAETARYGVNAVPINDWIIARAPATTLYAIWKRRAGGFRKISGTIKKGMIYRKVNGRVTLVEPMRKVNGTIKKTTM